MAEPTDLDRAHSLGLELLQTICDYWDLCCHVQGGVPPDDPRLDEFTRFRAQVRSGLERAETELVPQLPEFACVHEWPVTVNGFTAASAHQATLKFIGWLNEQSWSTAGFRAFYEKFYDTAKGQMDWDAVGEAKDKTNDGMYEFWLRHDWAEHQALLEMEYAKARKLAVNPTADVPLLADIESHILDALGEETMTAPEIAGKAGYPNNSNFRTRLKRMVERGILTKAQPHGYRRAARIG